MKQNNKDAFYFSHDSNAKDDPKCMLLIDQLGLEGYGIFWILIEILRDQPEYKYPIKLIPILARRYNTSSEKMMAVVEKYGFFKIDIDNNFFSLSLNNRMQHLENVRNKRRMAGIESGKKRKQLNEQMFNKCSTNVEQKGTKESKVKESKENKIKKNKEKFSNECLKFSKNYSKEMILDFISYWTELNKLKKQMRFELQPTFEIGRRLGTWKKNNFGNNFEKEKPKLIINA